MPGRVTKTEPKLSNATSQGQSHSPAGRVARWPTGRKAGLQRLGALRQALRGNILSDIRTDREHWLNPEKQNWNAHEFFVARKVSQNGMVLGTGLLQGQF